MNKIIRTKRPDQVTYDGKALHISTNEDGGLWICDIGPRSMLSNSMVLDAEQTEELFKALPEFMKEMEDTK